MEENIKQKNSAQSIINSQRESMLKIKLYIPSLKNGKKLPLIKDQFLLENQVPKRMLKNSKHDNEFVKQYLDQHFLSKRLSVSLDRNRQET